MPLRAKNGRWEYRFKIVGQPRVSKLTDLEATERNRKPALEIGEKRRRELVAELRAERPSSSTLNFATAAGLFVRYCIDVRHRNKPATAQRIKVSFSSLVVFFASNRTKSTTETSGVGTRIE